MPKELYIKNKDVDRTADDFDLMQTPMGLNAKQAQLADTRLPTQSMGPSEYDGTTNIEADSN